MLSLMAVRNKRNTCRSGRRSCKMQPKKKNAGWRARNGRGWSKKMLSPVGTKNRARCVRTSVGLHVEPISSEETTISFQGSPTQLSRCASAGAVMGNHCVFSVNSTPRISFPCASPVRSGCGADGQRAKAKVLSERRGHRGVFWRDGRVRARFLANLMSQQLGNRSRVYHQQLRPVSLKWHRCGGSVRRHLR